MSQCPAASLNAIPANAAEVFTNTQAQAAQNTLQFQGKYTQPDYKYMQRLGANDGFDDTDEFEDWTIISFKNAERNPQVVMALKRPDERTRIASKKVYALNDTIARIAPSRGFTVVLPPPPSNQPA